MKYLSNLEPPKAAVTFHGCEHDIQDHLDVVNAILKAYCQDPQASVQIYVSPSPDSNPLEWTMRYSSPRGLITVNITQRISGGSVHFSKG